MRMLRSYHLFISFAVIAALSPTLAGAQATTGTIVGVAREQGTGRPIPLARVTVVGTSIAVPTRDDGSFTINLVKAGPAEVRVLALGHAPQKIAVNVPAGGSVRADFTLVAVAVQLDQVVTTATGQQRKVEVGNDIPRINAQKQVEEHPITNITDLLNAKAPGVEVLAGTMTGTGQRIRIRGTNSISLNNAPIFIIDGIRMESATGSSSIGIGGSSPSRLSDIDPNQIADIEIVKGPSASTLYGTDAAAGVVIITTKRGRVGKGRWNMFAQRGILSDRNTYPTAYTLFGHSATGALRSTVANNCTLSNVSAGTCIPDSLTAFNLFKDPETTPLANSFQEEYGADVSGGSETLRYFLAGSYNDEQGVYKVPKFDIERLLAQNGFIPGEQLRPNALARATIRGNLNIQLSPLADLAVSSVWISSSQRLPQTENNTTGLTSSAYRGPGYVTNGLHGYRAFTPGDMFQETVQQDIGRFIGSVSPNWRPRSWLTARGNFGLDFTSRIDSDLCRQSQCSDFGTSRQGFKTNNRTSFFQYTFDASTTADFGLTSTIKSKTTAGVQYFRRNFNRNGAFAQSLPPGATTVTAGATPSADEATTYNVNAGFLGEETFSVNDRLFLTGAFRADNNSAFGTKTSLTVYPKASLSWVISEEGFFPHPAWLNQLRVRTTYGQSGTSPGANDALPFFAASSTNLADVAQPAIVFSAVGNPDLKPERATETELGFDADMFSNRFTLTFTKYHKNTKDALISRTLPPSAGVSTSRFENLGGVLNTGYEASVRAQVLQTRLLGFETSASYAINDNKLLSLGGVPPIGAENRQVEGYPLFGVWARPILSFKDVNGDGIITQDELVVGDSLRYLGRSSPHVEATFNPAVDLFANKFRITASFDYKGGFLLKNSTERIRCQTNTNCRGVADKTAPLYEQARVVAVRDHPSRTQAGFWDPGDYTKLREVAVTFFAPKSWLNHGFLKSERLSVTAAGRNLKTWTRFTGIDPEMAAGAEGNVQDPFQAIPPPTYWTLRFNFGF